MKASSNLSLQGVRDWQVKQEPAKKQTTIQYTSTGFRSTNSSMKTTQRQPQEQRQQPKPSNKDIRAAGRSRSGARSRSNESAHEIRQRVAVLTNNYIQTKEALHEEMSALDDSMASPDRESKARILAEQKARRKQEMHEKKMQAEAEAKKKRDALQALNMRFKSEAAVFKKQMEADKKSQERAEKMAVKASREKRKANKSHTAEQDPMTEIPLSNSNNSAALQTVDLRNWIEQQMLLEMQSSASQSLAESARNIEVGGVVDPSSQRSPKEVAPKSTKNKKSGPKLKQSRSKEKNKGGNQNHSFLSNAVNPTKLEPQTIPGNNRLEEKETLKFAARENRYGVFAANHEKTEFDEVVERERRKLNPNLYQAPGPIQMQGNRSQSEKDTTPPKSVDHITQSASGSKRPESVDNYASSHSDDSTDKVPVRQSSKASSYRPKINDAAGSTTKQGMSKSAGIELGQKMPGIMNMQSLVEEEEAIQKRKEAQAAIVIQKRLRGHWGRRDAKRQLVAHRHRIEEEYERLNRELKSNTEYNMKRYLEEKKRIRAITGLSESIPDEVAEVIGESSSIKTEKIGNSGTALQFNNFFKESKKGQAVEKDPLSLIAIFAKRNGQVPQAGKEPPKIFDQRRTSKEGAAYKHAGRKYKKSPHRKQRDLLSTESAIEEEYSEDFEDSQPKSETKSDSIKEESGIRSKTSSSSVEAKKPKGLKTSGKLGGSQITSGRRKVQESDSIVEDVIEEESNIQSDTIDEEDIPEASGASSKKKASNSIEEDSIIREEYSQDNFEVYDASQSLAARNRVRFGVQTGAPEAPPAPQTQEEAKRQADSLKLMEDREMASLKRKNVVGSLLSEMKEYEQATMSTAVVERMEKVVVASLAQKDQIIMAARLAQLEAENRHKEEINRIRQEQMQLMSQMMLLGGGGGGGGMTQQQRDEMMAAIKVIVEKPIEIKQETVNVNYSVSREAKDILASGSHPKEVHASEKLSYLEEYDRSKGKTSSFRKYSDVIEEDIALRSGVSTSNRKGNQSDSIDDIVDEVTSHIEESIKEELDISGSGKFGKITQSEVYKNKAFDDFKTRGYRDAKDDNSATRTFLSKLSKAINDERQEREDKLVRDMKRRVLSPRSFDRKKRELDKWVANEKKDLSERQAKLEKDSGYLREHLQTSKYNSPKSDATFNAIAVRKLSLNEDSGDSQALNEAIRQQKMLETGLTGMSPDQKYLLRKKEAAQKLLEQKEKAIQEGLKAKLENYQEDLAEEMIQKALNLDVNEEINKRYKMARKQIEESSALGSARSMTESKDKSASMSKQKKVKFAPSVGDRQVQSLRELDNSVPLEEDSIQESIQIAESISQSLRSQSVAEQTKSRSMGSRSKEERMALTSSAQKESKTELKSDVAKSDIKSEIKSEIESDYSEDFNESIKSSEKGLSKSIQSSKQRLQSKARDLEESNAYSENFEEETLGQSQQQKLEKHMKKMDTVKEESVDESEKVDHTGSGGTTPNQREAISVSQSGEPESLPSEDVEIEDSARSVDWKIKVESQEPQRPKSEKDDNYTEDDFAESQSKINEEIDEEGSSSSDINTRDEEGLTDLNSCPEEISKSGASKSGGEDLQQKADLITDELLKIILEDYKEDTGFDVNATRDQPDEEEFKTKFPWTLDKVPEKPPAPKPAGIKSVSELNQKPAKTARELEDEKYREKHAAQAKVNEERQEKVEGFLDFLCKRVDLLKLKDSLNKPIEQDPLKILTQIQGYDDEDSMNPLSEDTMLAAQQQILPQSFFNKVDREFVINQRMKARKLDREQAEESDILTVSQEETENIQNVHHYALFESLNEALDQERPYKNKGEPMPWSKNTRVVKQVASTEQAKQILERAKAQAIVWSKMRAGTNFAPLPEAPPQTQDELGEEVIPPPLNEGEEERRNLNRQERLAELMTQDIQENDANWIDYEIQDTQTRFDVADMILHHLAGEIAQFLSDKAQ